MNFFLQFILLYLQGFKELNMQKDTEANYIGECVN